MAGNILQSRSVSSRSNRHRLRRHPSQLTDQVHGRLPALSRSAGQVCGQPPVPAPIRTDKRNLSAPCDPADDGKPRTGTAPHPRRATNYSCKGGGHHTSVLPVPAHAVHDLRQKRLQAIELGRENFKPQHQVGIRVRRLYDHNPDYGLPAGRPAVAPVAKTNRTRDFLPWAQAQYDPNAVRFNSFHLTQFRCDTLQAPV